MEILIKMSFFIMRFDVVVVGDEDLGF